MEAGGAKSKRALASKANRSIVASSVPPRLSAVRCALIKAQMLPDAAGGKEGEGDRGECSLNLAFCTNGIIGRGAAHYGSSQAGRDAAATGADGCGFILLPVRSLRKRACLYY